MEKFGRTISGYTADEVDCAVETRQQQTENQLQKKSLAIVHALREKDELEQELRAFSNENLRLKQKTAAYNLLQVYVDDFLDFARKRIEENAESLLAEAKDYSTGIDRQVEAFEKEVASAKQTLRSLLKEVGGPLELGDLESEADFERIVKELLPSAEAAERHVGDLKDQTPKRLSLLNFPEEETEPGGFGADISGSCSDFEGGRDFLPGEYDSDDGFLPGMQPDGPQDGSTILLAEEDEDTADLLRHMLEREDFEVVYTANGDEASGYIEQIDPPRLALLDLSLPAKDGIQLVKQIRNRTEWQHVPILILADSYNEREIVAILDAGANDCISKPFSPQELMARLKVLIR